MKFESRSLHCRGLGLFSIIDCWYRISGLLTDPIDLTVVLTSVLGHAAPFPTVIFPLIPPSPLPATPLADPWPKSFGASLSLTASGDTGVEDLEGCLRPLVPQLMTQAAVTSSTALCRSLVSLLLTRFWSTF